MREYRVSLWPNQMLPVPELRVGPVEVWDRDGKNGGPFLMHWDIRRSDTHMEPLPDELYLREAHTLDTRNAAEVAAFSERFGRLGLPDRTELPRVNREDELKSCARRVKAYVRGYVRDNPTPGTTIEGLRNDQVAAALLERQLVCLDEAALYVKFVRDLTRVWAYHTGVLTLEQTIEQTESWEGLGSPETPRDLYEFMVLFLSEALQSFHPHPVVVDSQDRDLGDVLRWDSVSLYGALCLQLANHIVEKAVYRTCQKCGSLFYRQRDRAKVNQYRAKGRIDYCSKQCAHAVAQKRYQDKKKEALILSQEGIPVHRVADKTGYSERTIKRWLDEVDGKGGSMT